MPPVLRAPRPGGPDKRGDLVSRIGETDDNAEQRFDAHLDIVREADLGTEDSRRQDQPTQLALFAASSETLRLGVGFDRPRHVEEESLKRGERSMHCLGQLVVYQQGPDKPLGLRLGQVRQTPEIVQATRRARPAIGSRAGPTRPHRKTRALADVDRQSALGHSDAGPYGLA